MFIRSPGLQEQAGRQIGNHCAIGYDLVTA
jgi:hypothetical protein